MFWSVSATANPTARLDKHVHRNATGSARPGAEDPARRRTRRPRRRSVRPPAPPSRPGRNCRPATAASTTRIASDTTSPSGSIASPNRQTAPAMIASGSTRKRGSGSPSMTIERTIRNAAEAGEHQAEQQREIAGAHPAGRAERISARGEERDRREGAEHHSRPEILRRADSHRPLTRLQPTIARSNRQALPRQWRRRSAGSPSGDHLHSRPLAISRMEWCR